MSGERSERRYTGSSAIVFLARHPRALVACVALVAGVATQGTVGAELVLEPSGGHSATAGP
ncbi:hypothetical protein [Haloprofundus marisrubri]|uniref:hypothetical protein n=1 Tax=Haloprofundus marisrubri TaxID=1514971 RepID=UPI0012BA9FFD|nr:hypothetical protein [Haloprofundus marisrubri]